MIRRLASCAAVALLVAACSTGSSAAPKVPQVFDLTHDVTTGIAAVDPARTNVAPADQLRLILEQQMAWHGITLVEAMRWAEAGNADASKAWIRQLSANTDELVASIGLAYGPVGARAFQQQWAQHTQFLVDYATAVGRGDTAAERTAKTDLDSYVRDHGSFLSTATGGGLSVAAARGVLRVHVDHMIEQVDAAARDDRARSTKLALADHTYLHVVADDLSGAIAAQQPLAFPGPTSTPTSMFCTSAGLTAGAALITELGQATPTSSASGAASRDAGSTTPALHLLGPLGPLHLNTIDAPRRALLDQLARSYVTARARNNPTAIASDAHDLLAEVAKLAAANAPT